MQDYTYRYTADTRQQHRPEEPALDPTRRYRCRHVFTDGHRCGSPSLRGQDLCYYHERTRREAPCAGRTGHFVMPRIDDRNDIQLALFEVLSQVASGDILAKQGSVLLYGLQIASSNLNRRDQPIADQPDQVDHIVPDWHLGDLAQIEEMPIAEDKPVSEPEAANNPALAKEPQPVAEVVPETRDKKETAVSRESSLVSDNSPLLGNPSLQAWDSPPATGTGASAPGVSSTGMPNPAVFTPPGTQPTMQT